MKSILALILITLATQTSFAALSIKGQARCNLKAQEAAVAISNVNKETAEKISSSYSQTMTYLVDVDGVKYSITASERGEDDCQIESIVRLK